MKKLLTCLFVLAILMGLFTPCALAGRDPEFRNVKLSPANGSRFQNNTVSWSCSGTLALKYDTGDWIVDLLNPTHYKRVRVELYRLVEKQGAFTWNGYTTVLEEQLVSTLYSKIYNKKEVSFSASGTVALVPGTFRIKIIATLEDNGPSYDRLVKESDFTVVTQNSVDNSSGSQSKYAGVFVICKLSGAGTELKRETRYLSVGKTTIINAETISGYTVKGSSSTNVYVDQQGTPSQSVVTFYYTKDSTGSTNPPGNTGVTGSTNTPGNTGITGSTNFQGNSGTQSFNTRFPSKTVQSLPRGQRIAVYSGPATEYDRSANGMAEVSTNESISVWGYESGWFWGENSGWYLISYNINSGGQRFGYICDRSFNGSLSASNLRFAYRKATVNRSVSLTDDPDGNQNTIATLRSGSSVIYLATYNGWHYVEYKRMRGFIPAGSLGESGMSAGPTATPAPTKKPQSTPTYYRYLPYIPTGGISADCGYPKSIQWVQQCLRGLGYGKLAVDGKWGNQTNGAVWQFKSDYGYSTSTYTLTREMIYKMLDLYCQRNQPLDYLTPYLP